MTLAGWGAVGATVRGLAIVGVFVAACVAVRQLCVTATTDL